MEHRTILGGDEYLPFARSCVTKLKKLGLSYANQAFEVGGVSIKVRIEPGHEYIRIEGGGTAYMESGQLEWTFPGEFNPTRTDPAKWNFVDIPWDSKYLGLASMKRGKKFGDQKNEPLLTEDMNSKAIGPPIKIVPPGADAETIAAIAALNAEKKLSYEDSVVMRKLTASFFPASMFSGKMRLFMQAQYGATQQEDVYPFYLDIFGSSVILKYRKKRSEVSFLQFGIYVHSSPGIFRAPLPPEGDGSYWLINITKPDNYVVTAYPLKLSPKTAGMLAHMHDTKTPAEDKRKCEAYVLAHAVILIDEPKVIHSFVGADGFAFAYGWKFNDSGSEASVVAHKGKGEGTNHDWSWLSYTMRLSISVARDPDTRENTFSVADTTTSHGEWTDGWGYWNIFAPESEFAFLLKLQSLKTNVPGVRLDFNFSDVPIYGYYVNNVWTPVLVSRDIGTPDAPPEFANKTTGPVRYGGDMSQVDQAYQYGVIAATDSMSYEQTVKTNKKTMTLSFGGRIFKGETSNISHHKFTRTASGGSPSYSPGGFIGISIEMAWNGVPVTYPPGAGSLGEVEGSVTTFVSDVETTLLTYDVSQRDIWTLVIPPGDCEAVYVATNNFEEDVLNRVTVKSTGSMVTHFSGSYRIFGAGLEPFDFEPWTQAHRVHSGGFRPLPVPNVVTVFNPLPPAPDSTKVFCFNTVVLGDLGTPSGSYFTLFNVDRNYPYFNGSMYTYTSAGKRYVMSEGMKSPASVNYLHRFVGWA